MRLKDPSVRIFYLLPFCWYGYITYMYYNRRPLLHEYNIILAYRHSWVTLFADFLSVWYSHFSDCQTLLSKLHEVKYIILYTSFAKYENLQEKCHRKVHLYVYDISSFAVKFSLYCGMVSSPRFVCNSIFLYWIARTDYWDAQQNKGQGHLYNKIIQFILKVTHPMGDAFSQPQL